MKIIPFFVTLGFPGSGKTTLTKAFIDKHPSYQLIYVFDFFLKNNLIDRHGVVRDKDYIKKGHYYLFQSLNKIKKPTVLELGTSIPEYNVGELVKLRKKQPINLKMLFCLCDAKTALKRHLNRKRDVPYKNHYLMKRYKRDFPGQYERLCQRNKLPYHKFDMTKPISTNVKIWEELLID